MSVEATEQCEVLPGIFRWECYSPEHKVELASHAVLADDGLYIFDPIGLQAEARQKLLAGRKVAAIVLTNENHERAVADWTACTRAPVWACPSADLSLTGVHRWPVPRARCGPLEISFLEGGAGGEVALRWRERSLVVLGDAIFNLPKYGFGLLPEKYCRDENKLKAGLAGLTEEPFETVLLAHGTPLLKGASAQIRELLMA